MLTTTRAAAEMAELKSSVVALREALIMLAANADPAQEGVLRLNVRESQALLRRRLQQLAPPSVATLQVRGWWCLGFIAYTTGYPNLSL